MMRSRFLNQTLIWRGDEDSSPGMPTNDSIGEVKEAESALLSDEFLEYSTKIVYIAMNGSMAFFGIIFNVINITVFWKQGFAEVVNISLFVLAISDLGLVLHSFLQSVCYTIWINDLVPYIDFRHVQYLHGAYPKSMFSRTSSFIMAFISFERCICVLLPLKVKSVLTKRVSVVVIAVINIPVMASFAIPFICMGLAPQNSTSSGMEVVLLFDRNGRSSRKLEERFIMVISLYQVVAFLLVIFFTVLLVFKMRLKTKWRLKTLTSQQMETMATRDNKVITMVIGLCVNFIICLMPAVTQMTAMNIFDNYGVTGIYRRVFIFMWSICTLGETTCATVNIFFYFKMSSKYVATLKSLFWNTVCMNKKSEMKA